MRPTKTTAGEATRVNPTSNPLLRRSDQAAVVLILLASTIAIVVAFSIDSFRHGGLIQIDRAREQDVHFQVDINSASWPELALLPGIGETRARQIVASREQDGPFVNIQDLERVEGIGPVTMERVQPFLLPIPVAREPAANHDIPRTF